MAKYLVAGQGPHKDPELEAVQIVAHNNADMWRINIAELPEEYHRILTSYTVLHARDFVIFTVKSNFKIALKDFGTFSELRIKAWEAQGYRWVGPGKIPEPDDPINTVVEKLEAKEELTWSRDNVFASFATLTLLMAKQYKEDLPDYVIKKGPGYGSLIRMLKREFSPKPPTHVDLISLGFWEFTLLTLHKTDFMKLVNALCGKI